MPNGTLPNSQIVKQLVSMVKAAEAAYQQAQDESASDEELSNLEIARVETVGIALAALDTLLAQTDPDVTAIIAGLKSTLENLKSDKESLLNASKSVDLLAQLIGIATAVAGMAAGA